MAWTTAARRARRSRVDPALMLLVSLVHERAGHHADDHVDRGHRDLIRIPHRLIGPGEHDVARVACGRSDCREESAA